MAKADKNSGATAPASSDAPDKQQLVTYVPKSGDPAETTWNNHVFRANVPRPVSVPGMIDQARGNPWFRVGDEAPAKAPSVTAKPATSDEYRAYAVAWIMAATSSEDLAQRWADEAALRTEAGCGTDDDDYCAQFFNPKFDQLKRVEAESN